MSEVIVLGSGTSNGVPMLGYHYPDGYLDNPKNHRTRSSIILKGPEGNVLVDCAPEMRLQITREKIYNIDAVIITHPHADHVMGMDDLRSICIRTGKKMPIYMLPEYEKDIRRIYPYAFLDAPEGLFFPRFDVHPMPEVLDVAGMRIQALLVEHGRLPVLGIRVNNFAYLTDVSHVPAEAEAKLQGLDTLVVDGLRYSYHPNHFNLDQATDFSARIGAKQTYLTHLSHDYDHDVTNSELPPEIQLAFDGLHLNF